MKEPKILIAVPMYDSIKFETFVSLLALFYKVGSHSLHCRKGCQIVDFRNGAVQRIKETNAEYLMFIDADMEFPPDGLDKLLAHDVDIVSGMFFSKGESCSPCFGTLKDGFVYVKHEPDMLMSRDLIKVDAMGMAFTLIKRKVLEALPDKPFTLGDYGEDYGFCLSAKEKGFKCYVDTSVEVKHIGNWAFGLNEYKQVYQNSVNRFMEA